MNPDTTPLGPATKAIFLEGRNLSTHDAEDLARAAFESIDADQLADVILAATRFGDGTAMDAAQAVKNWLTGKDQQ